MSDSTHSFGGQAVTGLVAGTLSPEQVAKATSRAVTRALAEDLGDHGDITTRATVPAGLSAEAEIVAREAGVVSGLQAVVETFAAVDSRIQVEQHVQDGEHVITDQVIATVSGPVRGILAGERTALNFLGRLSGIATATNELQRLLEGTGCRIRDTRKTTPGMRLLEKAAVAHGGGSNHRIGLYDAILVKENHILAAGGVEAAVANLRADNPGVAVQVEVDDLEQLSSLLDLGVADILLDNFTVEEVRQAAARVDGRAALEVSGNLDVDTVRAYAEAVGPGGRLAVGAVTHSARSLDVALDVVHTDAPGVTAGGAGAIAAMPGPFDSSPGPFDPAPAPVPVDPVPFAWDSGSVAASPTDVPSALSESPAGPPVTSGDGGDDSERSGPLRRRVSTFFGRDASADSEGSADPAVDLTRIMPTPAEPSPADEPVDQPLDEPVDEPVAEADSEESSDDDLASATSALPWLAAPIDDEASDSDSDDADADPDSHDGDRDRDRDDAERYSDDPDSDDADSDDADGDDAERDSDDGSADDVEEEAPAAGQVGDTEIAPLFGGSGAASPANDDEPFSWGRLSPGQE